MSKLTLGPLLFNWDAGKRRDFYFRMADEASIDSVYIGEVVCSKRERLSEPFFREIVDRLKSAGKEVVISTLSLVTTDREMEGIQNRCAEGFLIEANDVSCIKVLEGKPFIIGPFINTFNEGTMSFLKRKGAVRLVVPLEMSAKSIGVLAGKDKKFDKEVLVFGRQTLSISMRCYHARAYGLKKDGCQFVCGKDDDGLPANTIDGEGLFSINGIQVMSHGYAVLLNEMAALEKSGVGLFRISPQDVDMVKVIDLYNKVMKKKMAPSEAIKKIRKVTGNEPLINGYASGCEGMKWS